MPPPLSKANPAWRSSCFRDQTIQQPSLLWVKGAENGEITALADLPFLGSVKGASGDKANRLCSYRSGRAGSAERLGFQVDLELRPGKALLTRRGVREDRDGKEPPVPSTGLR
jgi:hypothetical protein